MELTAHGVGIDVPDGWEAELATMAEDPAHAGPVPYSVTGEPPPASPRVLLHAANFALPVERGDYGSGAVEMMDSGSVLVIVMEFDRASARTALFAAEGLPRRLEPDDFSVHQLQRPQRNQTGTQRFFHIGDRAFCLYVVLGSHTLRGVLVEEANRILSGIEIEA